MNTAKQLISAFVDAPPIYWDRSYVQNMREIRGYPNWWRIRDDIAYIDGPPNEGEQYTRDLYVWSVEIAKDESDNNTNVLEMYDLDNTLEETTSVINGDTVYRFKYRETPPALTYEHTDVIDSVSLEFDQLGRRLIAFESMGNVFFIWYDPVESTMVVSNFGAGYNPQVVTDTYRRTGGSADSERLLFYVDSATKQIVYRRQDDRYQTVYTLPSAPYDIVELLKVSKNLYGGLTALYCYDDGTGEVKTGSFTARYSGDSVAIGTDNSLVGKSFCSPVSSSISSFTIKIGAIPTTAKDSSLAFASNAIIQNFELKSSEVPLPENTSTTTAEVLSGLITDFSLAFVPPPEVLIDEQVSSQAITVDTSSVIQFSLKDVLISLSDYGTEITTATVNTGQVVTFSLG